MDTPPTDHAVARRAFLAGMGATPALELLAAGAAGASVPHDPGKFTPLDLGQHYSASPAEIGPRQPLVRFNPDGLAHTPSGRRELRGIPFRLGGQGARSRCAIVLSTEPKPWTRTVWEIPVHGKAGYVCLAQFCDYEPGEPGGDDVDRPQKVGQLLGEAVLVYRDGGEETFPIRRRFEVCPPTAPWGQYALLALAHPQMRPCSPDAPLDRTTMWGERQTAIREDGGGPLLWICALANPHPERVLEALRLRAAASDLLAVCGITLFHGRQTPLRYERLAVYRATLPEGGAEEGGRWEASVDLGVVARTYALPEFEASQWLGSPGAGLGGRAEPAKGSRVLYLEITASPEATLVLRDRRTGRSYRFELADAAPGTEIPPGEHGPRVQLLERDRVWMRARVVDSQSGRPAPVRIAFRSPQGRYIPPYGHRTEINPGWFQDYGADLRLGTESFAYVDGEFQVELPTGDVFVEMAKGFEYAPVRKKLRIGPGDRELRLEIGKHEDWRAKGWVSADTHVHFLSPSTAVLEAQCEGLNLVNLLAAQWGDLYTNIGDLAHGPLRSRDGDTLVWPGTENRHHLMGHIGLLGGSGSPVFPLAGGFPYGFDEAYLGDPLSMSLSEWADACRAREGLAVAAHFPNPLAEIAADIVLGKIDAVEMLPYAGFQSENYLEWYRYLNCGYRLPIVGGTDKMSAAMVVGGMRTYAHIGGEEFSFANWGKAVRGGNTFATSGPLLLLRVDGRDPGSEITLAAGGAALEVEARASCFAPIHRLEIVVNGRVAASSEERGGARQLRVRQKLAVQGPGWIAARCSSQPGPQGGLRQIFAHTSPVYLVAPGQDLFSPPFAAYLVNLIDGTRGWVENIATRADPERYERIRKVFIDAKAELQRRLKHACRRDRQGGARVPRQRMAAGTG